MMALTEAQKNHNEIVDLIRSEPRPRYTLVDVNGRVNITETNTENSRTYSWELEGGNIIALSITLLLDSKDWFIEWRNDIKMLRIDNMMFEPLDYDRGSLICRLVEIVN